MPLDRNWKRKRQVEKKIISKDTYTTYMTNK